MSNATATTTKLSTKRNFEYINSGGNSDPRSTKWRRTHNNKTTNSNHAKRSQIGLLPTLLSLGIDRPTWILQKILQRTDLDLNESRLLLTSTKVASSPLLGLLTNAERELVCKKSGLNVRAFDRHGREYCMVFKFLHCNNAYRLIGEWSQFLRVNCGVMKAGDAIEIWGFRIMREEGHTEIGIALLNYDKEEEDKKEKKRKLVIKENVSKSIKSKKRKVTKDDWGAVVALLCLRNSGT